MLESVNLSKTPELLKHRDAGIMSMAIIANAPSGQPGRITVHEGTLIPSRSPYHVNSIQHLGVRPWLI